MAQKFLNGIEVLSTAVVDGSGLANGSSVLDVQGTQGQLFSVTDDLSGEIFAVSDISGVPIMTVNSSGVSYFDGKVGIGTQNPTTKLSLSDTTGISGTGNDTYGQIDLVNTETGTSGDQIGPFITFRGKRGAVDTTIAAYGAIGAVNTGSTGNSTGALTFLVKNAVGSAEDLVEQMRIETGGNVGIGETSPDRKLVLNGGLGTASLEIKKNNDRIVYLGTGSSAATADDSILHLMDQNVIKINLNTVGDSYLNGGNVGIGITAPVAKLDVLGTSGGPVVFDYVYTTNAGLRIHGDESAMDIVGTDSGNHASTILLRNGNEGFGLLNNPNLNTLQFRSFTATADAFSIHNTGSNLSSLVDIVTLEKDGNVGIGTDDPATILHLADDNAVLRIEATTNGQNCSTWYRANGNNQWETGCNISAGQDYQIYDRLNGASRMVVGHNGDVTIPGNVGIGTTLPSEKLDVDGNARVRNLTAGIVTSSATGVLSTGGPTPMNMSLGESYAANIREKYYRTNRTVYPSTIGSQFAQLIQQDLLNSMSLIMSPVAAQTSEVSSVRPENNSGDFSFTRATKASRVASSGYIVRQTENYIRYSNEFNNSSYWTLGDATVTWGQADYFGKNTAWKLQDTASTAQHFVRQTTGVGGVVTVSVYAKAGTKSFLYLRGVEGSTSKETFFNLSAGTVGTVEGITASMEAIGSGWYRCSASFDHNSVYEYYFGVADADNVPSYTGDGTGNIYIANAQIESGIGVREYNATTSSMFYGGETFNVPRIDYKNGVPELLLEKTSTNVVYCSAKMAGLTNVTQSFTLSPEGILNGIKINETAASNQHYAHVNCSVVAGTQYFLSFYIKKGTASAVTVYTQSNTIGSNATVNLNNGTISASGTDSFIEDVGGGWYRAGYKTPAASQTATSMDIYLPVSGLNSYAGDVDNYTEYYGIQLETAPIVTSHIPTYDGAVTRNNEIIALSNMATNTIAANATAATLMVEFSNNYTNSGDSLQWHSSSTIIGRGYFYVRQIGFADSWGSSGFSTTDGVNTKVIWRLNSLTSGSFFKDGVKSGQTVTGSAWADINKLVIRSDFGTMRIRNIFMASTDLTDDQCIKLTTINE